MRAWLAESQEGRTADSGIDHLQCIDVTLAILFITAPEFGAMLIVDAFRRSEIKKVPHNKNGCVRPKKTPP